MASTATNGKGAGTAVTRVMLDRIAAELATRRRPMTLAELLELIGA